jgi:hypothetical protein
MKYGDHPPLPGSLREWGKTIGGVIILALAVAVIFAAAMALEPVLGR